MIYLDHNATTAVAPEAVAAMHQALDQVWANPSSTHEPGQAARRLLATARAQVAQLLGCRGDELVFTSGATESNHTALLGALDPRRLAQAPQRRRLVLSAVEHPSMLALAQRLRAAGFPVDLIAVDAAGRLDLDQARALIGPDVALVSVMGANNETGVCMPLTELAAMAHAQGALLHVDATQRVGKSALRFAENGADLWSVSAHKLHGPKGIGALVIRKGLSWPSLFEGRQERARRGGTENLPGIVGFGAAAERAARTLDEDIAQMAALRQRFESGLHHLPAPAGTVHLYGAHAHRLANTTLVRFGSLSAERVLLALERAGVIASSGAACSAGGNQPSHVLLAMGASPQHALCGVRFSLGRDTTADDIDAAIEAIHRHVLPLLQAEAAEAARFAVTV
ncbi:cysteine desulfurase family protein [Thiomonas sp.]